MTHLIWFRYYSVLLITTSSYLNQHVRRCSNSTFFTSPFLCASVAAALCRAITRSILRLAIFFVTFLSYTLKGTTTITFSSTSAPSWRAIFLGDTLTRSFAFISLVTNEARTAHVRAGCSSSASLIHVFAGRICGIFCIRFGPAYSIYTFWFSRHFLAVISVLTLHIFFIVNLICILRAFVPNTVFCPTATILSFLSCTILSSPQASRSIGSFFFLVFINTFPPITL